MNARADLEIGSSVYVEHIDSQGLHHIVGGWILSFEERDGCPFAKVDLEKGGEALWPVNSNLTKVY